VGELTVRDIERLGTLDEAEQTFAMTEEAFRRFYDETSRPLWLYLARASGDARLADDLLQETYYRFLRVRTTFADDEHRRGYLFRIGTNLIKDHRRRAPRHVGGSPEAQAADPVESAAADRVARRIDLARAMERLKPRERSMLWLAYAQGCSHAEIAALLGLRTGSLKALLFRARRRLTRLLGDGEAGR
jgi:RNA polymerase sigma-70 factor (ECF subfamily)